LIIQLRNKEADESVEGEGSDQNSDTTINSGDAKFTISHEKWNIALGKFIN